MKGHLQWPGWRRDHRWLPPRRIMREAAGAGATQQLCHARWPMEAATAGACQRLCHVRWHESSHARWRWCHSQWRCRASRRCCRVKQPCCFLPRSHWMCSTKLSLVRVHCSPYRHPGAADGQSTTPVESWCTYPSKRPPCRGAPYGCPAWILRRRGQRPQEWAQRGSRGQHWKFGQSWRLQASWILQVNIDVIRCDISGEDEAHVTVQSGPQLRNE